MSKPTKRRRDALSRQRIIETAILILDRDGEGALTLRALATELETGTGALYHYVTSKRDLLAMATDEIIDHYLRSVHRQNSPDELRDVSIALWDAVDKHPWVGLHLAAEPNLMSVARIYEAIGRSLEALGVPEVAQFDAGSAIASYINGNLVQQATNTYLAKKLVRTGYGREAHLREITNIWRDLDADEYPYVHRIIDQFPKHDDRTQYLAGIDLILAGITSTY